MPPLMPPGGSPAAAPDAPPVGASPATGPVPNKGMEAAGMAKLGLIVRLMESAIADLGATSEPGKAVLKSLTDLSKHLAAGGISPQVEQSSMEKTMMQQRQMAPQIAQLRQAMMQGGAGGPPGAAPAASPMPNAA